MIATPCALLRPWTSRTAVAMPWAVLAGVLLLLGRPGLGSAQDASAPTHLHEPIAVSGGLISGTPSIQWTPGIRLYRGIPYAAAPVGALRWRPPQPVTPWSGVRAADHFGAACLQNPTETEGNAWRDGLVPVSEDCLYLNVWTPAQTADAHLPVMVFIHGGGNVRGAASENQYDGAWLAKKGVVYVSFNYRLNVFGFLALPALAAESPEHSAGNYALLDQIAALKWVQQNIAHFGGDPTRVMIFGHSAGSADVSALLASPLARGLFDAALMQSGEELGRPVSLSEAERRGQQLQSALGAHSLQALRGLPAQRLLNAESRLPRMGPIVDGWVLPHDVYSTFASGAQNDVPLIVGTVGNDTPGPPAAPSSAAAIPHYARDAFGPLASEYLRLYPSRTDQQAAQSDLAFRSDRAMASARTLARLQVRTGHAPVYWYWFTHVSPIPDALTWDHRPATAAGAYHGSELVYVFDAFAFQDWPWRPMDLRLGDVVSSLWVHFAKTTNPNGPGLPAWPAFDPKNERLLVIGDTPVAQPAPHRRALAFQDELAARQRASR